MFNTYMTYSRVFVILYVISDGLTANYSYIMVGSTLLLKIDKKKKKNYINTRLGVKN